MSVIARADRLSESIRRSARCTIPVARSLRAREIDSRLVLLQFLPWQELQQGLVPILEHAQHPPQLLPDPDLCYNAFTQLHRTE